MEETEEPGVTSSLLDNVSEYGSAEPAQAPGNQSEGSSHDLHGRLTFKLVLAVFACVIGSSFQFGFQTGVLNTPQQLLQEQYKYGFISPDLITNSTKAEYDDSQVLILWSVTVSIFGAGGILAGFSGSYLATKLGRKKMMLLNNLLLAVAVALMVSAKFARSLELLIVGRAVHGVNSGFSTVVAPLYLNEISPVNLRGGVGTIHQLAVASGILLSQVFGLTHVLGNYDLYYLLFGIPLIGGLLQLISLPFCPESPSWLYITRHNPESSKKALAGFGGAFNIPKQLDTYEAEAREEASRVQAYHLAKWTRLIHNEDQMSFKDLFTKSYLRTPLIIAVVMHLSQQWSGIQAVLNYSTSIFTSTGLTESDAQYATIGTTGVIVLMTLITVGIMDKIGRRILHLTGLCGCLVSMIIITIALFIQEEHTWARYLSIVSMVLFIMMFALGPGSIPWFITAELFDQSARPYAISLATLVNWLANFTSGLLFPLMQKELGYYCFIPFIALLVAFALFTFFKLPETKNRSTEQIIALFRPSDDGHARTTSQPNQLQLSASSCNNN